MVARSAYDAQNAIHYLQDEARIEISPGVFTRVDREDVPRLREHRWSLHLPQGGKYRYAATRIDGAYVSVHRFVTGAPKGTHVDHINGDTLDNRRRNLRICTPAENLRHRHRANRNSSTGYLGISRSAEGRYRAQITVNYARIQIGTFDTAEEAARARDRASLKHFGEFAYLNFPEEVTS